MAGSLVRHREEIPLFPEGMDVEHQQQVRECVRFLLDEGGMVFRLSLRGIAGRSPYMSTNLWPSL